MTNLDRLRRLEWSGEEAAAIAELADPEHRLVLTGPAATREAVLDADLRPYRFVHFATHSFIDTEYPSLSGLVLSRRQRAWAHGRPASAGSDFRTVPERRGCGAERLRDRTGPGDPG